MRISMRRRRAEASSRRDDPRALHLIGIDHVPDRDTESGDLPNSSQTVLQALTGLLYGDDLLLEKRLAYPVRVIVVEIAAEVKMRVYDTRHQRL